MTPELSPRPRKYPAEKVIVNYSGGKDSTAVLLLALEIWGPKIRVVHADTGNRWPETLPYIRSLQEDLGIRIEILKNDRLFFDLVEHKGFWPSARFRFCTFDLKAKPTHRWVLENKMRDGVQILGLRKDESKRRAKLGSFSCGGGKERGQVQGFSCHRVKGVSDMWYPILEWKTQDVYRYIESRGVTLNPIYDFCSRLGCPTCLFAPTLGIYQFAKRHPAEFAEQVAFEQRTGLYWKGQGRGLGHLQRQVFPLFDEEDEPPPPPTPKQ